MNCLLEAVAGAYLAVRARLATEPIEEEVYSAQDGLEVCKKNMEVRERELTSESRKLGEAALACKRQGDQGAARARVVERRRAIKRLEKLRSGMVLIDSQIDAIKMSELDKEIMLTLRQSTSAMKKAGIGVAIQEAEKMMGELGDHMDEMQNINEVLAMPVGGEEDDLDEELSWLEESPMLPDKPFSKAAPPITNKREESEPNEETRLLVEA